jgi:hypothetical protein
MYGIRLIFFWLHASPTHRTKTQKQKNSSKFKANGKATILEDFGNPQIARYIFVCTVLLFSKKISCLCLNIFNSLCLCSALSLSLRRIHNCRASEVDGGT